MNAAPGNTLPLISQTDQNRTLWCEFLPVFQAYASTAIPGTAVVDEQRHKFRSIDSLKLYTYI